MERTVDWRLITMWTTLVALATWIPLPWVDRVVANLLRRGLYRRLAARHGVTLDPEVLALLADEAGSWGCAGCLWSIVVWPFKKLLKWLLTFLQVKEMVDAGTDTLHRALLLEEALEMGWLPAQPEKVRAAMDEALSQVEHRVGERAVWGRFREKGGGKFGRVIQELTRVGREQRGAGEGAFTAAVLAALDGPRVMVPEAVWWFDAAMGRELKVPGRLPGAVEAEVVHTPAPGPRAAADGVVDAEEVRAEPTFEVPKTDEPEDPSP